MGFLIEQRTLPFGSDLTFEGGSKTKAFLALEFVALELQTKLSILWVA